MAPEIISADPNDKEDLYVLANLIDSSAVINLFRRVVRYFNPYCEIPTPFHLRFNFNTTKRAREELFNFTPNLGDIHFSARRLSDLFNVIDLEMSSGRIVGLINAQ
jgi:hypothetical protein